MGLLAFQIGEETLSALIQFLPSVAAVILAAAVMMWFLAWMSRYFEYLKTLESRWLDRQTLTFVHRVLEVLWLSFIAIIVLAIAQTQSDTLKEALRAFVVRVPALFFAIFVVFAAAIVVKVLHRFAAYLRGELKAKPRKVAPPQALAFTEVVLKYVIYISAFILAILGGIRALPEGDQAFIRDNIGALPAPSPGIVVAVLAGVLIVFLADRFVDSLFEDMKRRTRKFSARVVDEFKSIARYSVWIVGAILLLFVLLDLILDAERLVIFAVGFVTAAILVAVVAFEPARNALAGVTLMRADSFDVGDRVKIGNDLVCDVVSMSLTLTQVRTLRGELVNLPNTRLLHEPVVNFSRSKPYAIIVEVGVGFDVAHGRIEDLLTQAAKETAGIVAEPAPTAFGKEVEGEAILYQLLAYTDHPERMKEIKSALIYRIQELFNAAGVRPKGHLRPE